MIPAPRLHPVRYYGHYAHVPRARRRIYEADPVLCTCGAPMRTLSFLTEPPVIRKILEHLDSAGREAARAPPGLDLEPDALAS